MIFWVKRIIIGLMAAAGTIIFFVVGSYNFIVWNNKNKIERSSPMTAFILEQQPHEESALSPTYFTKGAEKEDVLNILAEHEYLPRDPRSWAEGFEPKENEIRCIRIQVPWGIAYANSYVEATFNEDGKLVSISGHNGGSYW